MDTLRDAFGSRYNTPLIADAAFRAQVDVVVPRPGVLPLADAYALAGPVRTVNANNDLVTIIAVVGRANPGEVVVIAMDGVIFVEAEDLAKIAVEADRALEREAGALEAMAQGASLSELFAIEEFIARRAADPNADFNAHLAQRGKAI